MNTQDLWSSRTDCLGGEMRVAGREGWRDDSRGYTGSGSACVCSNLRRNRKQPEKEEEGQQKEEEEKDEAEGEIGTVGSPTTTG